MSVTVMKRKSRKEHLRSYHQAHKDQIKDRKRAYRQAHKDQINAHQRSYRQAHKDQIKDRKRAYLQRKRGIRNFGLFWSNISRFDREMNPFPETSEFLKTLSAERRAIFCRVLTDPE